MKNIAKRFLSAAIAAIILIGLSPVNSFKIKSSAAEETTLSGTCGENVTYSLNENTGVLTISGTGKMAGYLSDSHSPFYKNKKIKEVIIEDGVTSIGKYAFYYCSNLTSITIPGSVTSIGSSAFEECNSLTSIVIPEGVTSIGEYAFFDCSSLTNITIPEGVTRIGCDTFYGCSSLTSITIPESVTSIDSSAFEGCKSLTSITIPEGVTSISYQAFYNCSSLTSIVIPEGVTSIGSFAFHGCSSLTSITIPESVTSIGDYVFYGCSSLTSIAIPKGVTRIGSSAFENCSGLTSVTIPDSVEKIDKYVFRDCSSLTSITIPKGITSIGDFAFSGCSSLTSITIPERVASIGDYAFGRVNNIIYNGSLSGSPWGAKCINGYIEDGLVYKDSSKKELLGCSSSRTGSVSIPNSVEEIGDSAFYNCSSLTSITIPEGVTSIGEAAFYDCSSLTSVTVPESVTNIGIQAFGMVNNIIYNGSLSSSSWGAKCINGYIEDGLVYKDSSKKELHGCSSSRTGSVSIPNSVGKIGDYAFYNCRSLTSIVISEGVTSIGSYVFSGCSSLAIVTIPKGVTSIGYGTFKNCSNMTSITIPEGVTSIGGYAFFDCISLTSIIIPEGVTSIDSSAFYGCNSLTSIIIPKGVTRINESTFSGCSSLTSITIPESVTSIGGDVFFGCSSLTSVTIPKGVTSIGESAFFGCSSLTSVTIPKGLTSIDHGVFNGCSRMTNIIIPESVTSIGWNAFYGCSSLTSIAIPKGVTSIGRSAFFGCSSLTSIIIPEGVTSIGDSAFYGCISLTSVTIPKGVTSIGNYAFKDCNSLICVTIFEGITSIGSSAFYGCSSLTSIAIPEGVTSIGSSAFYNCISLTSVTIPEGVTSIGSSAFYGCSSLTSITIPESVTSIDSSAFYGCSSLTSVTIPKGVTSIGGFAFYGCSGLTSITIPEGVTSIGEAAFYGCSSLTSITIPEGVTSIGEAAFYDCSSLTSVTIPEGVKTIEGYTFFDCSNLTSITIPKGVTSLGDYAFHGCSGLTSITIPEGVTSIGDDVFSGCSSLTNITIPEGITSITLPTPVKSYTLSYNANGGSNAPAQQAIKIICKGWSANPNAFDAAFYCGEKYSSNANITLYAIWNDSANRAVSPAVPVRTGYTFRGWSTNENAASASITAGSNISISEDTTLYAVWEKIPCTVTLNANGGTCDTNTISLKYGDEITLPIPIKEDCEFLGWYTELEGGEKINDSTAITSDMTLYAHWYSVCKFKISSVETTAGDVIEVPVKIVNNKGIMGFSAQILYDNSVLTPIEVKKGAAFSGGNIVINLEKLTPGELKIVGYSAKESRVDDVIYTVAFKVSDSAEGIYKLRLSYDPDNTFDGDLNEVSLQCEDGSVNVKKNTADRTLIYMEDKKTICGNEISIPIKIKNQKELQAVSFNFEYDSAVLDFVSVTSDFDNISYSQNGKFIAISLSSLDKCKDETPIAYVNLVAKSVAETVVKLSSDNDIDVNNGIVSVKENYSTKPTLYADNVVGKVDSTVKVPICIKNNPGISGFKIKISYDPTALQPESLIAGASFPAIYDNLGRKNGEISAIWIESSGKNVVDNGEIFNINFKILKKGTHKISVTYSKADTFNEKSEELNLICRSGNVFAGNLLMPKEGTSIVIDYSNKYIYGIDAGIQSIKPYVYTDEGYTISEITAKQGFGTAAKVNLMLENDMVETYTVVLFGDVNGDGWYDGQDAVLVNMIANGMLTREQVGEAVWMAADCNHDGVIDQGDVDLLNRAGLLLSKVDQTKPT